MCTGAVAGAPGGWQGAAAGCARDAGGPEGPAALAAGGAQSVVFHVYLLLSLRSASRTAHRDPWLKHGVAGLL